MIIWRRKGWLVPVILFISYLMSQIGINSVMGDGYYQSNEWTKNLALILAALLVALFGYWVNHKKRETVVDEDGNEKKSASHTLFFIPVEYWAIIFPVFIIWMSNYTEQKTIEELAYIKTPMIGDLYLLDISRTRKEIDSYKYGVFKVVNVQSDGVDIVEGGYVFEKKKGLRKELRDAKVQAVDYYLPETYFMDTQSLITLKTEGDIFEVRRAH